MCNWERKSVNVKWGRKKILVTGGASFIGSHLVEKLVTYGSHVVVADNLSSGKKENLSAVLSKISFHVGDLREKHFAESMMNDVDVVFHLAANHGGRGYIATHPADCSSNMILDGIVFDAASRLGVDRVCFASSACVYPKSIQSRTNNPRKNHGLLSEEMANPFVEGRAFADEEYGWAKLMGEMTLKAYYKQYGLKGVSCRIYTCFGPRENETHAIIALIAKAFIEMDPYEIWGTGEQDRNFTYVEDTVEGLIKATEGIVDASPVNIGTAKHIKIKDAANMILKYTGFHPKEIFFNTAKPEGVFSRAADLKRARTLLNWEPRISFESGLKRTVDWYYSTADKDEISKKLHRLLYER
jgi:UDP-glucose 4-epimerase